MLRFIKKLFSFKKGKRTVVIFNDDGTDESTSHKFKPRNLWLLFLSFFGAVIILVIFFMIFTPLGGFVYNQQNMRKSVVAIQQQVVALQDSIKARNMQLQNLRQALFSGEDSVFTSVQPADNSVDNSFKPTAPQSTSHFNQAAPVIPINNLNVSLLLKSPVQFPAPWPVKGTLTRKFSNKNKHFGIDIAAKSGERFYAIANGVVIGLNWTLNYGNVLYIQHGNGIVTIYKHASEIAVTLGDIVSKGDVLGRVGNTGIVSSGPHLHMEIWANGIPQNPLLYLVKS